jgi:hypothetical protein
LALDCSSTISWFHHFICFLYGIHTLWIAKQSASTARTTPLFSIIYTQTQYRNKKVNGIYYLQKIWGGAAIWAVVPHAQRCITDRMAAPAFERVPAREVMIKKWHSSSSVRLPTEPALQTSDVAGV